MHKGQTMMGKPSEVARRELNCKVELIDYLGTFENIHRHRHDISHCFLAKLAEEKKLSETRWAKVFEHIPRKIIPYHGAILNNLKMKSGNFHLKRDC